MKQTKTYKITFNAELTEDDVRAMKKCFFDAMNESMDIHNLWGLELSEESENEDDPQTSTKEFTHISQIEDALLACKNIDEVNTLLDNLPRKFGDWWVDTVVNREGHPYYEVTNQWYENDDLCTYTYELEINVEEE